MTMRNVEAANSADSSAGAFPGAKPTRPLGADEDMPAEVRIANGVRGRYLPADELERSRILEERLYVLQLNCAQLREAAEQVARAWREVDRDQWQHAAGSGLDEAIAELERVVTARV
jgi:hypothetical protein